MKIKYAIIGGGVAGLCCAIRLAEMGEEPLLIEGGSYPSHKVCGEFISPECLSHLHQWNIDPVPITKTIIRTSTNSLVFSFPTAAGGISHLHLDPALANHATKCGAQIKTATQVISFHPKEQSKEAHIIQLSNGEWVEASHVIIATGRIPNYHIKPPAMVYLGFKAHFENLPLQDGCLEMFSLLGAYMGISQIEDNKYNVACLAKMDSDRDKDPTLFIRSLLSKNPHLESYLSQGTSLFDQWMVARVPAFGIKQTPDWLDTYFIGDAAVTIPPASGNGLSMAIIGGRLAAEYAKEHQAKAFKSIWSKRCSSQVFFAKLLHFAMLNPPCNNTVMQIAKRFPYVSRKIFELTRHHSK